MNRPYCFYRFTLLIAILYLIVPAGFAQAKKNAVQGVADTSLLFRMVDQGVTHSVNMSTETPKYLLPALKMGEKSTDERTAKQVDRALVGLGSYYTMKGNHDSSAYFYNKLLKRGETRHDGFAVATADLGFGLIADYQADYQAAIKHNMDALRYFESVKDTMRAVTISSNIGNTCIRLKQYDRAVKLLSDALEVYQKRKATKQAANTMANLARAYKGLGNKEKELELKLKAYAMFKADNYKKGMATVTINLGVFYEGQGNMEEAFKYYQLALKYSREIQDKGNIAILFNNLSDYYLKSGRTDLAIANNDSAWYYASRNGDKLSQSDALHYRSNILHALGKHTDAEKSFDKYLLLKDSIYNDRMQKQIAEMEVKYETDKKESQILLLNEQNSINALKLKNNTLLLSQNKLQLNKQQQALVINSLMLKNKDQLLINEQLDAEKKEQSIISLKEQTRVQKLSLQNRNLQIKQRNYAITAILIIVLTLIASAYFYYGRYKAVQDNRVSIEISKQKEIANKSLFEGEQNERIRIARDLHDSIGQMLAVIKMKVNTVPDQDDTSDLVDQAIKEVRTISHNLIPETLNFGLFAALEDLADKITAGGQATVSVNIPDDVRQHHFDIGNELSIYRIVQEVLSNMVKHAQASHIDLNMVQKAGQMTLSVKDNGKGFDTTGMNASKGIGWKNIAARVNLLNGDMQVRSEQLTGTQIEITIPQ